MQNSDANIPCNLPRLIVLAFLMSVAPRIAFAQDSRASHSVLGLLFEAIVAQPLLAWLFLLAGALGLLVRGLQRRQREAEQKERHFLEQAARNDASLLAFKGMAEGQRRVIAQTHERLGQDPARQLAMGRYIEGLNHSAEESSSSIIEMVTINNEVRENLHNLALSVQETSNAIEEMAFSSKEVARNIDELSKASEETAASMNAMDVSISQVEANANETSRLSETVSTDAETGVSAIKQTIIGIDRIRDSSGLASNVIGNLGEKISDIGNILNVIDDVAEQTNLLALNAAIIAAQAGEHGRGFAVVADEIKALAERTGASTKEIADLVKTIQDQSRRAVDAMAQGVASVDEGVRLGHNAEDALRKIVDSTKRCTLMIHAIAQATVEQAKGSKQVTNAISRIAETVQQIAFATTEQAKSSDHIMQSAEKMRGITQQVERSADEQNRGGRQVTQAIETIRELSEQIGEAQRTQGEQDKKLLTVVEQGLSLFSEQKQMTEEAANLLNPATAPGVGFQAESSEQPRLI